LFATFIRLALGVPRETWHGERRVSLTPMAVASLVKKGFTINVESGAGVEANFKDGGLKNVFDVFVKLLTILTGLRVPYYLSD
jgi:NAD/NADP transhydrogenase alpha subunit